MCGRLGWNIQKNDTYLIKINEGPSYELALQEFLDNNPDKTKEDFPYVEFDASHMSLLFAQDCADMYQFFSDIFKITKFKYYKSEFYCLEIEVLQEVDDTGHGLRVNLYVNKDSLGGYKPQVGDNITGFMQLTAYIPREPVENENESLGRHRIIDKICSIFSKR